MVWRRLRHKCEKTHEKAGLEFVSAESVSGRQKSQLDWPRVFCHGIVTDPVVNLKDVTVRKTSVSEFGRGDIVLVEQSIQCPTRYPGLTCGG